MKILLIQDRNLINGQGGVEKICCFLANGFLSLNNEVEIATNQNITGSPVFPLDEKIKVTNIYSPDITQVKLYDFDNYQKGNPLLWIILKLKKKYIKLKNAIIYLRFGGKEGFYKYNLQQRSQHWKGFIENNKPDIIITMTILALLEITYENSYTIPIINSINGRPDYDYTSILWKRGKLEEVLLKESYKNLSGVQILFDNYKNFLPETFNGKCHTISNPVYQVNENEIISHSDKKDKYKIINVASLATSCKQQDIAIRAFSKIAHIYPKWEMYFWGTGSDYDLLSKLIVELNLTDKIHLMGFTDNPIKELFESDIFIFPSKYEGFPLALTEAMSVGLPCIGFDSCSGVNELIQHNKNGLLASDESEITKFIELLINDFKLRNLLGNNAHYSMKKYEPKNVLNQWESLLNNVLIEIN